MRFPPNFLDDIRSRIPVSVVVARKVKLTKRGREFVGLSPFNNEKTPSFTVNDQKGFYHCFSSGRHGDIFRFLMEVEGLQFPEAVERLAGEAGIAMPARDEQAEARAQIQDDLYSVMDAAAAFFRKSLETAEGAKARGYLSDRRLSASAQQAFGIGYAPASRNALRIYLEKEGFAKDDMVKAGLLIDGNDIPVAYDRFRDRLMFPISDLRGRTIAFGGRALSVDVPAKYLNSPETPLFHKGHILYNAQRARQAVHDGQSLIVAEGYMDVIALVSAGFGGAIAPLGTALTEDQLALMWRLADEPILCFDGDKAGLRAAYRALDIALPRLLPGKSIRFALLPDGLDPDDLIREQGTDAMRETIENAQSLVDLLWVREYESGDWSIPERRAALDSRIGELVNTISNESVRRHYRDALNERLRGTRPIKDWQFRKGRPEARFGGPDYRSKQPRRPTPASDTLRSSRVRGHGGRISEREAVILIGAIRHPELVKSHAEAFSGLSFANSDLQLLRDMVFNAIGEMENDNNINALVIQMGAGDILERVERSVTHGSYWWLDMETAFDDAEKAWLQTVALHHRVATLQKELRDAQRALEVDWTEESFERLRDINAQIQSLSNTDALIDGFGAASGRSQGAV